MDEEERKRRHRESCRKSYERRKAEDPEFLARRAASTRKSYSRRKDDPEFRNKKKVKDSDYRKRTQRGVRDAQKQKQRMATDSVFREKVASRRREYHLRIKGTEKYRERAKKAGKSRVQRLVNSYVRRRLVQKGIPVTEESMFLQREIIEVHRAVKQIKQEIKVANAK